MGTRGPTKKTSGRQRTNHADVIDLAERAQPAAPAPVKDWLVATKRQWAAYWKSPVARLVDPMSDREAIFRLFGHYDERERSSRAVKNPDPDEVNSGRMVLGSQGQPVLNPLIRYIADLDKEIRALEDRFGLTPTARLRLGVTFGNAAKSLDEVNRGFEDDAEAEEEDPRQAKVIEIKGRVAK